MELAYLTLTPGAAFLAINLHKKMRAMQAPVNHVLFDDHTYSVLTYGRLRLLMLVWLTLMIASGLHNADYLLGEGHMESNVVFWEDLVELI